MLPRIFVKQDRGDRDPAEIRVMFFSDAVPDRNGVGSYYTDLMEHLQGQVADVSLYCPFLDGTDDTTWIPLPVPGDPSQKMYVPNLTRIMQEVERFRPTVVIASTPGPFGLLGLYVARLQGIPFCFGYHTQFERLASFYWSPLLGQLGNLFMKWLHCYIFRSASLVVVNSDSLLTPARLLGAKKVQLVGTLIARQFLNEPQLPSGSGLNRILFAGRLAPEKNLDALVRTARDLPHIRFTIAGDGPLKGFVEKSAAEGENLEYLGWMDRSDIKRAIDQNDLVVLPSHFETFGTIALEAMARARQVLVTRQCGISQWPSLDKGLFKVKENEDLTGAIRRIGQVPESVRKEKTTNARQVAMKLNASTVRQWCNLLELLNGHGHRPSPSG